MNTRVYKSYLGYFVLNIFIFHSSPLKAQNITTRPNVIVILTNDLGYGDLICNGAKQIQTPNVDRMAKEGLRFTNAHSMASTCTSSRFTILTGEYAFRKQGARILLGNASLLISLNQATLGTIFQKAGYHTADVGKWHVGLGPKGGPDWNGRIAPGPNEVGFNYSFIFQATADHVLTIFVENHHTVVLDTIDPITVSYTHKAVILPVKKTPGY
jgi:arylsulfatase A-like enzyme